MTGPGSWETYRVAVPVAPGERERALVHQMLYCLEQEDEPPWHAADTANRARRLGRGWPAPGVPAAPSGEGVEQPRRCG